MGSNGLLFRQYEFRLSMHTMHKLMQLIMVHSVEIMLSITSYYNSI